MAEPKFPDVSTVTGAKLHTSVGVIEVKLFSKECPNTVGNFVGLAEGTIPWTKSDGKPGTGALYNHVIFHRIIPGFMIQGGDPEGTGRGGPGYRFADELNRSLKHNKAGILSMANAGPNTNGSQFFITTVPTPHLDMRHAVFGEVVAGLDVVKKLEGLGTESGKPKSPAYLERVEVLRQG